MLLVVEVEDEIEDDEEEDDEEEDDGLIASAMTPKSLPCAVPNDSVAEDSAPEIVSY